jgi:hypothetical protein
MSVSVVFDLIEVIECMLYKSKLNLMAVRFKGPMCDLFPDKVPVPTRIQSY